MKKITEFAKSIYKTQIVTQVRLERSDYNPSLGREIIPQLNFMANPRTPQK